MPYLPYIFHPRNNGIAFSPNSFSENLIDRPNKLNKSFTSGVFSILRPILLSASNFQQCRNKIDGGSQTAEEDRVYSWLYALARTDKDLVFEYVRSTERGLSFNEAERRLRENGPNIAFRYNFPRWWHLLWNAFFHPFNIILIVLSALSYIARNIPNGCILIVLVFISVFLRFYQEFSSSKMVMKLSEFVKYPVKVQRCAGRVFQTELIVQFDQKDVVPGDIVIFESGDLFPGDVRLLSSKHLIVSQSSLTGESGTLEKRADIREDLRTPLLDLRNICFMGTSVVSGSGTGLVVSTGSKTYISTIFSTIGKQKPADDFERGVRNISYVFVVIMLTLSTLILLADLFISLNVIESILFGISVASALTPQMLPLIVNTSLSKGALAMARDRCIVKSINAIQNMGSMDILCIDKTGTLTMDYAILVNSLDSWASPREKVLHFAFLNAYFKTEQKYPLDDAILTHAYTNSYGFKPSKWRKLDEIPFDFTRRRVSVLLESDSIHGGSNDRIMICKGALEEVMDICGFIERVDTGVVTTFSPEDHQRVLRIAEEISNDGLRVIGVAKKTLNNMKSDEKVEEKMVFLGLITFFDPPKDSAKQALCRLAEQGLQAKVLTGDSVPLTIKVCKEVGIETEHVITGPELEVLDQASFHESVQKATVLARLTPTQKLRVVQSLQTLGNHVVGFLGDGINDSLAIDAANVGISVDSGASIAKDCADIILLEKDLNVLVRGVERGRMTLANTVKYIKMCVVANTGTVLSLLIAILYLRFEPLTARQLLVQNFLCNVGQLAIPWDKIEDEYVRKPKRWSWSMRKGLFMFILWNGPVCSLFDATNLFFLALYYGFGNIRFVQTALFVEGLLMQTLIIHLIRTEKIPVAQEAAAWPVFLSTLLISALGILIPFTPVGGYMDFVPLPFSYFGFLALLFLGYFVVGQGVKRVYIRVFNNWL